METQLAVDIAKNKIEIGEVTIFSHYSFHRKSSYEMNILKGASANRTTKIKVFEDGKKIKTIPNASINFGQNYDGLKKMLELALRLSPTDPYYKVEKVFYSPANGSGDIEFDQSELEQFQAALFKPENFNANKTTLCVSCFICILL